MKRIYNYIFLSVFAFAAAGCLEDDLNPGGQLGNSGDDVQFGLSLNDPSTKTIYGPESTDGKSYPLYWSEGDKIQIASPQCVDGRRYAEYLVTPQSGQSYALAMTKTGNYGVQWGNSATADFYSIYPSNGTSWATLESGNVVAKLNISSEQSANLVLTAAEFEKDAEGNTTTTIKTPGMYQAADMKNVIMYAPKTTAQRGDVVKLNYKPYSTILEFELGIAQNQDTEGNELPAWGTVKIVSMTLTAPDTSAVVIAGDFSLTFNDTSVPIIEAVGNNSKSIKMDFTTRPVLNEENQTLKAKIAMIPLSGVKTLDGWKVKVDVLEGISEEIKSYTKTFTGSKGATALAPGKVHKLKLPKFSEVQAWNPPVSEWIPTLEDYKNIYLTELSLPGAWYAGAPTDEGYQSTESITDLWEAGVRAFGVECRVNSSSPSLGLFGGGTPESVVVSGTGQNSAREQNGGYFYYNGSVQIRSVINSIATNVNSTVKTDDSGNITDGEFAVLVLSYSDGGKGGRREVDFEYFINAIKTEIANSGVTDYIYSNAVGANTTVANVLGKLIIKINVDERLPKSNYDNTANTMLFSYNPLVQQLPKDKVVGEGDNAVYVADYEKIRFSNIHWKTWSDDYKQFASANDTDFQWCFASSNRTQLDTGTDTTIPTYKQRKTALRSMIQKSKEIADGGTHNIWFYFNAGGTQTTSETDENTSPYSFATNMNEWLLDVITLKANGGTDKDGNYTGTPGTIVESNPSSLGLVFFNHCTNETYHGPAIINEIIQMNNKFKLQRANQTTKSAAPSYSSGMKDSDVAAFGWD